MSSIKRIVRYFTGYWLHKVQTLPIGVDIFHDINIRLKHGPLQIVFDVGANEGQTLNWVKHYQPNSKVISFEPVKKTFEILKQNASQYSNCEVENMALGEESGKVKVALFDEMSVLNSLKPELMNHDPGATKEEINVVRLDDYCIRRKINKIDLLKIDTEGFELSVLKGAGAMLDDGKISFVYCEVGFQKSNKRNTQFQEILTYLEAKQYYFYALYQIDSHDWKSGNHLANALFVHKI